jgi:phosphoglycerol geranylgeranyltransferase
MRFGAPMSVRIFWMISTEQFSHLSFPVSFNVIRNWNGRNYPGALSPFRCDIPNAPVCHLFMRMESTRTVITMKWKDWVHVTKLDPDKQLKPGDIDAIAASGTDALMLSGTLNVTQENLAMLLKRVKAYDLPLVMEPADPEAVLIQGIDYVFVPSVMNTTDVAWLVGKHQAWVRQQKKKVPWEYVVPEAYIVLNPDSSVSKVTKSVCNLNADEVAAYVTVADRYFHFPIVYIEYSGMYGNLAVVKAASDAIDRSVLYYGGGINSAEKAAEMSRYADTIVVGNAVYDQGAAVLKATVDAIQ